MQSPEVLSTQGPISTRAMLFHRASACLLVCLSASGLHAVAHAQPVLHVVAKSGDPVPDVPDRTFYNFGSAYINNAGDIAFQANLGNVNGSFVSRGAFVRRQGQLRMIAQVGDSAPAGFPGLTYQDPGLGVSNLDESGNVLLTSLWRDQFGNTQGYGIHTDVPGQGFFTILPAVQSSSQWPALWSQFGGSNFRMGGGYMLVSQFTDVHGGPVTGPMSVLCASGRPVTGWPCSSTQLQNPSFNSIDANGVAPITAGVNCGTWCGIGACASAIYRMSPQTGALTPVDSSCPAGANTPSGPLVCPPTATRQVGSAFTSLSGRTTWTRYLFNGDLIVVRDGVDMGSLYALASTYIRPNEEPFQSPSTTSIGEDGTISVSYSTRVIGSSTGLYSTGVFVINPDGSTSHMGRSQEAVFPGGPLLPLGFSTSVANANGVVVLPLFDGVYSWDRLRGWRRVPGTNGQVQLGVSGPVVRVLSTTVVTSYQAGSGRGLNDANVLAVVIDSESVNSANRVYAVVTVDVDPSACPADFTGDEFIDDADFVIFAAAYEAFTIPPANPAADLTADGFVDDADFVIFAAAYEAFTCR